ncbi:MAG: hypothetical protein KUG77_10795 [Nannocystaceae bacterium]|nr:hypothetical protein [Nannocystaceae bacterium]
MRPVPVIAFSQASASAASVVDFDPRHEVILLCSATRRGEAAALAETLLALGFDAFVVSGTPSELGAALEGHGQGARPALLVATDPGTVGPVLRRCVTRLLSRPYDWLEGEPGAGGFELQHRICARMDAFEREHSAGPSGEELSVDEVSNVVLLPLAAKAVSSPPQRVPAPLRVKKLSRVQLVAWPLVGAGLTALGLALWGIPDSARSLPTASRLGAAVPTANSPLPPPEVEPSLPSPVASGPVLPDPAPPEPEPIAAEPVLANPLKLVAQNEHGIETDDLLVYEAPARARDWYAAMNLCRGRSHVGTDGWSTPSSKQLHALAKARVLPEGSLWSRTRALRAENVAFVVHGKAGTIRRAIKTETLDAAVCVRRRTHSP